MGDRMPWNAKRQDGALISTNKRSDARQHGSPHGSSNSSCAHPNKLLQRALLAPRRTLRVSDVARRSHSCRLDASAAAPA